MLTAKDAEVRRGLGSRVLYTINYDSMVNRSSMDQTLEIGKTLLILCVPLRPLRLTGFYGTDW